MRGFQAQYRRLILVGLFLGCLLGRLRAEGGAPDRWAAACLKLDQPPVSDRLAEPVLGASPTQVEAGHYAYYYNCMPCHGDRGQGLTDEWRQVWVEDHQNCWARGCHTGKAELASFYIPRLVPAVLGLDHFQTAEELFTFLRETQPPQRPGALSDAEYWALTAFLLNENGRLSPGDQLGPKIPDDVASNRDILVATLAILLALSVSPWLGKRSCKTTR